MAKSHRKKKSKNRNKHTKLEVTVKSDEIVYCKRCEVEHEDKIGHQQIIHERRIVEYNKNDQRKLIHCPQCLPNASLFLLLEDLNKHKRAVHSDKVQ